MDAFFEREQQLPGFLMSERRKGKVTFNDHPDIQESGCELILTIESDDIETMINDPSHSAKVTGTVLCECLSAKPLTISSGVFNLFVDSESEIDGKEMRYNFNISTIEGRSYRFQGTKYVKKISRLEIGWEQTTTLFVHIFEGTQLGEEEIARGVLNIAIEDFARTISSITITNTNSMVEKAKWKAKFFKFFAETIWYTYFSVLGKSNMLNPDAPPRQKRQLNVCGATTEIYPVVTSDNVLLKLTRYNAGPKGPLLCIHGMSVNSVMFNLDTIPMNFVEFFAQNGYDVWLLDDRQSNLLSNPPICHKESVDGIGKYDIPATVDTVLEETGKQDLLLFAYCQGAYAAEIAITSGLVQNKIRAFIPSQAVPTPVGSTVQWLKSIAHISSFLDAVGMHEVTSYTDTKAGAIDTVLNCVTKGIAYGTIPHVEKCNSAVCHRITGIFGRLFEHKNLNVGTHSTLHEIFGVCHASYTHQILAFVKNEKLVDRNGEDIYIPGLDSTGNLEVDVREREWVRHLDIPIYLFIGAVNQVYTPSGAQRTYQMLQKLHPDQDYVYAEVPGYGHVDGMIGQHAVRDVWPGMLSFLDKYA